MELYTKDKYDDNNQPLKIVYEAANERWEVAVTMSEKGFQQVSFVNSIATTKVRTSTSKIITIRSAKTLNNKAMTIRSAKTSQLSSVPGIDGWAAVVTAECMITIYF